MVFVSTVQLAGGAGLQFAEAHGAWILLLFEHLVTEDAAAAGCADDTSSTGWDATRCSDSRLASHKRQHQMTDISPNSITPTFTETSPWGKSWTQIMKVADTNGDKS